MPHNAAIAEFLAKYTPEIAAQLQAAREHLYEHFPRGFELVYDNYNALVFAFASSERASDAILSVAGYPSWVTLFFAKGTSLPDPTKILEGAGTRIRSVRLNPPSRLHEPTVQALIHAAKDAARTQLHSAPRLVTLVKSVSAKQRAREPAAKKQVSTTKASGSGASGA